MKERVILTWSGGKDSALTLLKLQHAYRYEVVALLSTVNSETGSTVSHNIPLPLIQAQAEAIGLPLHMVDLPPEPSNQEYENRMDEALSALRGTSIDQVAFGDIFLEDIREFRDQHLSRIGMKGIYPLWQRESAGLAQEIVDLGLKAVVCCVDTTLLDAEFIGRPYDADFLRDLPRYVDPCGENGEFHTFIYDAPNFLQAVRYTTGATYRHKTRFIYQELLP
ncbi:MAG: diphthine--ammonia ligase, partial [Chloroflexota bacterium]